MEPSIRNNLATHQFETEVEGKTAYIQYKVKENVMTVLHTIVPKELEGRGLAAAMSTHVLQYLAEEGMQVVPLCPYMSAFLKKHPEYQHLIKN
ncbi:GNAT family N-acetyltransferase [Rufibacter glacialis]|uniref:N-acetyltransferase n=1 Tax=Rufibacter glacialis TaxID=1259555 RepID=A0A5M8QBW7_9BACT|nr:GNAT family N-acetyltransferase [Rufibacter glacialis]KAA6433459.1 N-acetyltransferase [Rufibacter glacialis]GGK74023.1 N-acetyltransferase [Rufibacter glacialis]